jgi:hypothetical protein
LPASPFCRRQRAGVALLRPFPNLACVLGLVKKGFTTAIIFLAAILALAILACGAFTKQPSLVVAVVAVAGLASLLSWYAVAETHSLPWGLGYGAVS